MGVVRNFHSEPAWLYKETFSNRVFCYAIPSRRRQSWWSIRCRTFELRGSGLSRPFPAFAAKAPGFITFYRSHPLDAILHFPREVMSAMSTNSRQSRRDYQRAYKACYHCRKGKTRCLMSGDGSCTRCARQGIECIPSNTHALPRPRARELDRDEGFSCKLLVSPDLFSSLVLTLPGTAVVPRRTILDEAEKHAHIDSTASSLRTPVHAQTPTNDEFTVASRSYQASPNQVSQNPLARSVVRTVISGANDALNVLFDLGSSRASGGFPVSTETMPTPLFQTIPRKDDAMDLEGQAASDIPANRPLQHAPKALSSLVRIWKSCHFVRMGWLTAYEALQYIDL